MKDIDPLKGIKRYLTTRLVLYFVVGDPKREFRGPNVEKHCFVLKWGCNYVSRLTRLVTIISWIQKWSTFSIFQFGSKMKTKSSSQSPPTPGQSRKRRKVMSVESDVDDDQAVFIECRRSVVDIRQMLNQWKYFRHNENFTGIPLSNLTIFSFEKTHCNSALTNVLREIGWTLPRK